MAKAATSTEGKNTMRKTTLPILLAASLAVAAPVSAQTDFGKIVSEIAQSLIDQELDRTAYLEAQRLNTVSAYRNYLTNFPKGAFRVNAERALAKLGTSINPSDPPRKGGGDQSAASVEASIGLSRTQRIQIQKQLTSVGYSTGVADGLWGANTRRAITQWQTANKLSATGYVTAPQVRLIAKQAGSSVGLDIGGTVTGDDPIEERLLS
ncbi:MAG: peptidoglycan-binding domain-containing protein, partial [Paracoccaceae bacterium]